MTAVQRIVLSCLVAFSISNGRDIFSAATGLSRIVGGKQTTIDWFPYILQLRNKKGDLLCGATLVAPRYVISAAHCFGKTNYTEVTVIGGATTLTDEGVKRHIARLAKHPEYSVDNYHSDIVVLKLDADMVGPSIRPTRLCDRALHVGEYLQISGWGQTGTNDPVSHYLQTARVSVVSTQTCSESYGLLVKKNMLCAYIPGSKDACGGDSGGPAVANEQLCGVVSFGQECGSQINPGVYTDVYAVRDFIYKEMKY